MLNEGKLLIGENAPQGVQVDKGMHGMPFVFCDPCRPTMVAAQESAVLFPALGAVRCIPGDLSGPLWGPRSAGGGAAAKRWGNPAGVPRARPLDTLRLQGYPQAKQGRGD